MEYSHNCNLPNEVQPSNSDLKIQKLSEDKLAELYVPQTATCIYDVPLAMTTKPTIVNKLPELFSNLPIVGKPTKKENIEQYYDEKILEFINPELDDEQYKNLKEYCSPENLKTGNEIELPTSVPMTTFTNTDEFKKMMKVNPQPDTKLFINKYYQKNMEKTANYFKHLKYRGVRLLQIPNEEDEDDDESNKLVPGKDIILKLRIYRPFPYNSIKLQRIRHSVCVCDLIMHGSQTLTELRDRILCPNDLDMRVDVSDKIDDQPTATAREMFPSGFLFINNVFFVDTRPGCKDLSEIIRKWAITRGLGEFQCKDMSSVKLQDLILRLGYPEVYFHQGKCEHLFTFSDIRLVTNDDALCKSVYPYNGFTSSIQNAYCATCAEFCAKWVVTDCLRIPFDPAFLCDTCLRLYMYKDGKKIGQFKAFSFKMNDLHLVRPSGSTLLE